MKGIILAGGSGTRLHPLTISISKQIIPIYDKPMIYYPLSILMLSGIREILIISTGRDLHLYKALFGDGNHLGLSIQYAVQDKPNGIAEAFIIGETFIGNDSVCLVLGDNLFYGYGLTGLLKKVVARENPTIFGYQVVDPQRYGVVEFDQNWKVIGIEEKPNIPKSRYAVPGLYFYDNQVISIAKSISPSERGELEITEVNNWYLKNDLLQVELLGRGIAWLDTGTHDSLLEASNYIRTIQKRQNQYVACIEEIAYREGYIGKEQLMKLASSYGQNDYGKYIEGLVDQNEKI